ncbi:FG-GAP-like repeat-containing protein [Rubripirellula sp.]|nr:FG-GAP-like repeat-containing protein [Rubripirellula sp.]MDB4749275.1 FG-GAP-like repeat-containing protein [Rubripirellula sp.]
MTHRKRTVNRWLLAIAFFVPLILLTLGCSKDLPRSDDSVSPAVDKSVVSPNLVIQKPSENSGNSTNARSLNRDETLNEVARLAAAGDFKSALPLLQRLLLIDPDDVAVLFQTGLMHAGCGELPEAIDCLAGIPEDHPEAGVPALGQAADWCVQLKRFDQAIDRYQRILAVNPGLTRAQRQLAYLLNRQGRRHEAAVHIRELCRAGDVRQEELQSLIVLSDAMLSEPGQVAAGELDYSPIGESGAARKLFTERRYAEAAAMLRDSVENGSLPPSIIALYGRVVAESQDDVAFKWWLGKTNEAVREYAEYWSAIGTYLASERDFAAATRAFLESLDRDPTDFITMNRLLQTLKMQNKSDDYAKWEKRWKAMHEILLDSNEISDSAVPDVKVIEELAARLNAIDRRLEAVVWKSIEAYYRKSPPEALKHWNIERQKMVAAESGFPDRSVRICGLSLDSYPVPEIQLDTVSGVEVNDGSAIAIAVTPAEFRNVAREVGLKHAFELAPEKIDSGFAMYHQAGGGVAVLDFDRDGFADLYFAQGAAAPPEFVSNDSNVLYRNVDAKLIDVTESASVADRLYTMGCTAGDWNQDGFPDLITANIGANYLWINNGDGTFTRSSLDGSDDLERMPASVAMADLNADNLPDIFEVNYIQDSMIGRLPERDASGGVLEAVGPADFEACSDRIGLNDGKGKASFQQMSSSGDELHKGLGVVIADLDGRAGNDVFVGNDKSANQLWTRDPLGGNWSDVAVINGSAFSSGGAGTASMGIACGDFDKNAMLDLHIANFQNESACLYLNRGSFFQDRASQYRLGVPSRSVLGFGSQAIDYDNNGQLDIAVTNGHIDEYEKMSGPFRQMAQLFCNLGTRFELVPVADDSGYWGQPHLGRAMAKLDFNHDGRIDLAVTHLSETSALLKNETASVGHCFQLELVGSSTERDAIGAKVQIEYGDDVSTDFLIAGDGYLCRNESVLSFGLGNKSKVDRLTIQWPTGTRQVFSDLEADRRWLVVENQDAPFLLFTHQ